MDVTYMENLKNGYDMLYLAACALQDIAPEDAAVKAMDLEGVYAQAEKQMLLAITKVLYVQKVAIMIKIF